MESDATSVYLSARYPVRPIVALDVLTSVDTDSIYSSCEELEPQGQWETPGFVLKSTASNSDSSDVVVCVQRPLANATNRSLAVLTDLSVVLPTESCPEATSNVTTTEITSDEIKLCAEWGVVEFDDDGTNSSSSISSQATSPFVAELALYETAVDEAEDFNVSSTLPGAWNVIGNESTGSMQTFFLARKFEPYVLNTTSSGSDDEISSSVEAVASNSSQELSFKVLQIADMHLTGNPDYPCSSGPDSILPASWRPPRLSRSN